MRISTDKLTARMCRESYFEFFKHFWSVMSAERLKMNWHIKAICDELQLICERVFADEPKEYDFICNCPPGTSKSTLFSIGLLPWTWTRMPSFRMISGSYSERLSLDLNRKCRDVIISDKYRAMFPEIKLREDQNAKGYFVNTQGGMRFSTGVGGTVTGMHAHAIIIDDPIDPLGVNSDSLLKEVDYWMVETLSDRKVDKLVTPTGLVMQRLHQFDPTGSWLERGGRLLHFCLPAELTDDVRPERLRAYYVDGLLDPVRLPNQVLQEARDRDPSGSYYAGQYLQTPVPRGGAMFKVDKFVYSAQMPEKWKRGPVRYWDKAASTTARSSFTVGVKMAIDFFDRLWILDMVRGRWESGERERVITSTATLDGKKVRIGIEQEPGGGGKEAAERAARSYAAAGFRCTVDRVTGTKEERAGSGTEMRADSYSIQVNTGNVIVFEAPWNTVFVEEHRFFPNSRYKDCVDAASGGYGMLSKARLIIGAL